MKKAIAIALCAVLLLSLTACGGKKDDNRVVIYTSSEEYRVDYFQQRLDEQFPDYEIVLEYMPTGTHAAKLVAEGAKTECDISLELDYGYLDSVKDIMADLSDYDTSIYVAELVDADNKFLPWLRNGGCIAVNRQILDDKNLPVPKTYEDLLKEEYKGLISMPGPKSSGTGYMFLKSLINAWGEQEAFTYFDKLTPNVLQYTSSGSGPVNALVQGEAAIGLAMTAQTVTEINNGADLEIYFFEEGAPYSAYGMGMIEGKQDEKAVREVFDFLYDTLCKEDKAQFFPEQIYANETFVIENYPQNIIYADMSNNSAEEKERILEMWKY